MVQATPFQRLLAQAQQLAASDPAAAFAQRDDLYGKSLSDTDVRDLAAFVAHVGGSGLGQHGESISFCERCLEHPALDQDGASARSIHRAIAVLATTAGDDQRATAAIEAGVRTDIERARVAMLCAQALVARNQGRRALDHLSECQRLMPFVPETDELRSQAAQISIAISQAAERRLKADRRLLLAASDLLGSSLKGVAAPWQEQHMALFQRAKAHILAGEPAQGLALIQRMLALEEANKAGPELRVHSATLACRAQIVRGQLKIAAGALAAARQFASNTGEQQAELEHVCDELGALLSAAKSAVG
ncbi:MAG: hypothetical protein ACYTF0_06250 [Planctomycetota bacterium]|jgi:hypothetical protein